MKTRFLFAALACCAVSMAKPTLAGNYPVSGRWGQTTSTEKGPVDCGRLRVIAFNGDQRTDSKGGVPAYRNRTIQTAGAGQFRVVDEFTTGQIGNAKMNYTLRVVDAETLELHLEKGGTLRLRKCK